MNHQADAQLSRPAPLVPQALKWQNFLNHTRSVKRSSYLVMLPLSYPHGH